MSNTWLIVANSSQANLYNAHLNVNGGNVQLLKVFTHPESCQRSADLISDKTGHFNRGAYSASKEPKEIENERFAHELAHMLMTNHASQNYSDLVIVAPPHFLGLLRKAMKKHAHSCISTYVEKDYTHIPMHELASRVSGQLH
jgi:protein required for attachment to host cells